ncbi:MAG: 3-phosphoshikimate 1-carboxyvinyltransferase [Christensenellales bacterium]|jgi:3-phosphoshikimate 1-carboxyvinyltransferase
MSIIIPPATLSGAIKIQPSKSMTHRAAICAALAGKGAAVINAGRSEDTAATLGALASLGIASFNQKGNALYVSEPKPGSQGIADCGESGSTLRFLIPIALLNGGGVFSGRGRLMQRPLDVYRDIFTPMGVTWQQKKNHLSISGKLSPGEYRLPGNVSSQFVSGLLFALPLTASGSVISLSATVESRGYIDMTLEAMSRFGVWAGWLDQRTIEIPGNQSYKPAKMTVEGDYSHAAFFLCAGAMGGDIECLGLSGDTSQGDSRVIEIIRSMGGDCGISEDVVYSRGRVSRGATIDVSQIPDLVPALSVLACAANGVTRLENAARLRIKESDRLSAMAAGLSNLGADITEGEDFLEIRGNGKLKGGSCSAWNDHRIAMSLTTAAAICEGDIILDGHESVAKSAPEFYNEYKSLGGKAYERE